MVKRHYVGHTFFLFPEEQLRYNILSLSVGLLNEKRKQTNNQASYWYTFRLLTFIFHQILITYNSITLTFILKFLPFLQHLTCDFQIGSPMRFFMNASKLWKRSHFERTRPKKCASIDRRKKWRKRLKKVNLLISDAPEIKWVSYLCFIG